jgi:hypothetical protein
VSTNFFKLWHGIIILFTSLPSFIPNFRHSKHSFQDSRHDRIAISVLSLFYMLQCLSRQEFLSPSIHSPLGEALQFGMMEALIRRSFVKGSDIVQKMIVLSGHGLLAPCYAKVQIHRVQKVCLLSPLLLH